MRRFTCLNTLRLSLNWFSLLAKIYALLVGKLVPKLQVCQIILYGILIVYPLVVIKFHLEFVYFMKHFFFDIINHKHLPFLSRNQQKKWFFWQFDCFYDAFIRTRNVLLFDGFSGELVAVFAPNKAAFEYIFVSY